MVTTFVSGKVPPPETFDLLDAHLPTHDVVLTEHLVVDADTVTVFEAAKNFDFLTTRASTKPGAIQAACRLRGGLCWRRPKPPVIAGTRR